MIMMVIMSFNTTLVQLKVVLQKQEKICNCRFQYHTGSIKRVSTAKFTTTTNVFQYHTGSIKSTRAHARPAIRASFQYHTGSIKRVVTQFAAIQSRFGFNTTLVQLKGDQILISSIASPEFQYHTGSIKSLAFEKKERVPQIVSIPHWFN